MALLLLLYYLITHFVNFHHYKILRNLEDINMVMLLLDSSFTSALTLKQIYFFLMLAYHKYH